MPQRRARRTAPTLFLAAVYAVALAVLTLASAGIPTGPALAAAGDEKPVKLIPNRRCLKCHNDPDDRTSERDDGTIINIYIDADRFEHSVHGEQPCMGCHNSIKKAKHEKPLPKSIGCVECHMNTWEAQRSGDADPKYQRLDVVLAQIDSYMRSVHARPNLMDQSKTNATCYDCHDAHNVGTVGSAARAEHRSRNPEVCGRCHTNEKEQYLTSVHGRPQGASDVTSAQPPAADGFGLIASAHATAADAAADTADSGTAGHAANAAICSDCHTPHNLSLIHI